MSEIVGTVDLFATILHSRDIFFEINFMSLLGVRTSLDLWAWSEKSIGKKINKELLFKSEWKSKSKVYQIKF